VKHRREVTDRRLPLVFVGSDEFAVCDGNGLVILERYGNGQHYPMTYGVRRLAEAALERAATVPGVHLEVKP
jgi:hypothetical protein